MPTDRSRRLFVTRAMSFVLASPLASLRWQSADAASVASPPASPRPGANRLGDDALDEALEALAGTGPEYGGGLANHGPMACDALVALGRPDAVMPWVATYRKSLGPHPAAGIHRIEEASWRESLGQFDRFGDWIVWFDRQLADAPWTAVLDSWVPRLAPGLAAAGMHGLIRTGHAARSLAARQTPARRHELAEGLAYWAARHQSLPERDAASRGSRLPSEAIADVPHTPDDGRRRGGSIVQAFHRLDGFDAFAGVAGMVDTSRDAGLFLSDLTSTFAKVYLGQRSNGGTFIGFLHGVTAPGAIRLLAPHIGESARAALLRYGWQAAAGVYSALARQPAMDGDAARPPSDVGDLVERALATRDEHAFKVAECCLRENAIRPDAAYVQMAHDVVGRLA